MNISTFLGMPILFRFERLLQLILSFFFKVKKNTIVRDLVLFLERTDFDFFLFCDREHDGERFLGTVNPINI